MTRYPGVHRKGPGRGWIYRWREVDAQGRVRKPTSVEYPTQVAAAIAKASEAHRLEVTKKARARPHREGLSLRALALSHPSTQRDPEDRRDEYLKYLDAFAEHAGVVLVHQVTVAHVQEWIEAMRDAGLAFDTRRHRLLYLRRACAMGPSHGLPDVLNRLRLDRKEDPVVVESWSLAELARMLVRVDEPAARAAIALGGVMGLRPSEICRATIADLGDGVLEVGGRERKRQASHRRLPVPAVALPWLQAACLEGGHTVRDRNAPLIRLPGTRKGHLRLDVLNHRLTDVIAEHAPKRPVKHLRKTCATWLRRSGQGGDLLEAWLGHETSLRSSITAKHYTADLLSLLCDELRPLSQHIDRTLRHAIADVGDTTGDRGTRRGTVIPFNACIRDSKT